MIDENRPPIPEDMTPASVPRSLKGYDRSNIRIKNMLASIERTFLPVGSNIGKYRIIEEIDRGGMAVVYKATQLDLDRTVALKVMPANITINHRFVERFLTEAHAVAKLSHPNIVSIYEVAVEDNIYYLSMEYIGGKNLYYYLHFHKPKLVDVLEILSRLSDALAYAHRQKIIHRDLKLNNVIMRDQLTPVLIDFGLAKALESEVDAKITQTGEIMGSPSYMAPERLLGDPVDHRSDICSLGIMLYEMLTFKNPYLDQRNLHQTTINVMEANPIPPRKLVPWLPVEIEAITLKAMAKDPLNRYQTMEEFKADINRYQRGEPVIARPPSAWSICRRFVKRNWAPLVIGGLIATFSALFGFSVYLQSKKEQSHWQLVYNEKFNRPESGDWTFWPDSEKNDSAWSFTNGSIHALASDGGRTFARLERRFNRDILIEFDVVPLERDLFNTGFFLFGDTPDSAYCFHINRKGQANYGITFPGNPFLFQDVEGAEISAGAVNHIIIERNQNAITFSINGRFVGKVWDYLPPLGEGHERLGFFVDGCAVSFDNLRIHRRAIPQAPSPTLIADRFCERGDFDAAIEEYRGLLLDIGNSDAAKEIHVKMADCLIRLQKPAEALEVLRKCSGLRSKEESVQARVLYLEGIARGNLGEELPADSVLQKLAVGYPVNPVNHSAMASAIVKISRYIQTGKLDIADRDISTLSGQYPRYSKIWGKLYLEIMYKQLARMRLDSASHTAQTILSLHLRDNEIAASAKTSLGRIHLHNAMREQAIDLFNQCITSHTSTEGAWNAWMELAGIYEYDFAYKDAATIYQKVYRECPKALPVAWIAAIKIGELASRDSSFGNASQLFSEVASGNHPFPVPRMIAQLYLGEITESIFKTRWSRFFPDDRSYLPYFARKAIFKNESVVAKIYLQEYRQSLPQRSWDYFRTIKILNNLSRW